MSLTTERALIFGAGDRGRTAAVPLSAATNIIGFVDNDTARQHTSVLGWPVYPPAHLAHLDFDIVYVASTHMHAIREQLMNRGISADRIRLAPEPGAAPVGVAEPPAPLPENALSLYLEKGFHEIAGWLYQPAVEATRLLADVQQQYLAPGPVCEIGVWEGRYLTLLSFLPATPQRVLAIDPLIHGGDRDAQLSRLLNNIATYARRPDMVTLIERDSRQVTADTILSTLGGPCQFVSVDGDHTMEGAMHDLRLAEAITAPGGIVALDDVPNFSCPGVTEAIMRHASYELHTLAPFLLVSNKLFLTQREFCERYRQDVLARVERGGVGEWGPKVLGHRNRMKNLGVPVRFLGQELLVG